MARHGFRRGCLIGNLGQEMSALPESYRDRLEAVFQDWQRGSRPAWRRAQSRRDSAGCRLRAPRGLLLDRLGVGRCTEGAVDAQRCATRHFRAAIHQRGHALIFVFSITGGLKRRQQMFKGILIEKDDAGYRANLTDIDEAQLPEGDVTVAVQYSTLNYKDGLAITGKARWCASSRWCPASIWWGRSSTAAIPNTRSATP